MKLLQAVALCSLLLSAAVANAADDSGSQANTSGTTGEKNVMPSKQPAQAGAPGKAGMPGNKSGPAVTPPSKSK